MKLICEDCGGDLKNARAIESKSDSAIHFVAHCDNPECERQWEWVNITRQLVGRL